MDKYNIYDTIVSKAITNIYSLCKGKQEIIIKNFDFEDEDDLFFLEIIKIANSIFNYKVCFHTSFVKNCYLKFIKRLYFIDPRLYKAKPTIDILKIKHFMKSALEELPDGESFADIYNAYYKKG